MLDTNMILRYLLNDNESMRETAKKYLCAGNVWITLEVAAELAVEVLELGVEVLEAGDDLLPPLLEVVPASDVAFGSALRPVSRCAVYSVSRSARGAVAQGALDIVVSQAVAGIAARCLIGHDLQHTHA